MPKARAVAFLAEDLVGWKRSLDAFLVEKERVTPVRSAPSGGPAACCRTSSAG